MTAVIAHVYGVAIVPGVSRNGRLWTPKIITESVAAAQSILEAGNMWLTEDNVDADGEIVHPIGQRTHHNSGDDSVKVVGRVTSLTCDDDCRVLYEADISDTPDGHAILELIDNSNGPAFLRGVSVRGDWLGTVRNVLHDGMLVETADGFDWQGLDYTQRPGVLGAGVTRVERVTEPAAAASESVTRTPITESVPEARVASITEEVPPEKPTTESESVVPEPVTETEPAAAAGAAAPTRFADPNYHDEPRLPLDTVAQARGSWHHLQESAVADDYTANQLKRVRERTQKALREHGVEPLPNGWLMESVQATPKPVLEYFTDIPVEIFAQPEGSFSVRLDNGTVSIYISSWSMDPHDLTRVGRSAMDGAAAALELIQKDMDGGGGSTSESAAARPAVTESATSPDPAGTAPAGDTAPTAPPTGEATTEKEGEPGVSELTSTPAAPAATAAPGGVALTDEQFEKWLATQTQPPAAAATQVVPAAQPGQTVTTPVEGQPAAAAMAGAAAESAPAAGQVTESEDDKVNRLVQEALVAQGVITAPVQESDDDRIQRLVIERVRDTVQGLAENGQVGARKGLVPQPGGVAETASGSGDAVLDAALAKPFHEHNDAEKRAVRNRFAQEIAGVEITDPA